MATPGHRGGVVQMVEYMLCTHQVIGSNPVISNKENLTIFLIQVLSEAFSLLNFGDFATLASQSDATLTYD